jgi:diaminopropionate ammonia-lyase
VVVERNPAARPVLPGGPPPREPLAFHRALPGYAPTPLVDARALAGELGLGALWLKDESWRLGLPAFKVVGASWAVAFALREHLGLPAEAATTLDALRAALGGHALTLVAATDGNHGRAVARMGRLLGLGACIYVPADMVQARRAAIGSEGAEVVVVDGSYDDAVARSAQDADAEHVVVSDTSWPGYETIPAAVIDGYSTVLWEIDDALRERGEADPDVVLVQVGVGAFAAAVARHFRRPGLEAPPLLVGMEPERAACALASIRAGGPVTIPGVQDSIMSGLNCATPSPVAWPSVSGGIDLFCAIADDDARTGMRDLAGIGVVGGECAGGGVGAVRRLREAGHIEAGARVLTFLTEGATDPAGYEAVVGRPPEAVDPDRAALA